VKVVLGGVFFCVQADDAEDYDEVEVEDVGDSEGEAEDYAKYAGPVW